MALLRKTAIGEPEGKVPGPEGIYQQHLTWGARQRSLLSVLAFVLGLAAIAGWAVAGISVWSSAQLFPLKSTEVVPLIVD